ncbi:hypothetical protein OSF82_001957 [Enterococcus hirae]|uniref:hypothetical protein n=1 Tax=Enterococcus hirae TaxID=1354 RepID=UPI000552796F|nr:hypothetical protein [Enterococcus hirae]OWW69632.1 hypothetical protein C655_05700 [Enterococcus hirae 57-09-G6]EMF0065647.1 hypothetical protein [Enterococcus hirae]EMF0096743.1 hypothetical protein [Enterococcus hirae]EMF0139128.1 hypothetical protein [Enterococcus hirae]EMF0198255.1 hypothetical protein [Enterococcus hirae]
MKKFLHVLLSIIIGVSVVIGIVVGTIWIAKNITIFGFINFIKWFVLGIICLILVAVASVVAYEFLADWKCFGGKENND